MAATLFRILALIALTMMPFGMAPASAAPQAAGHHDMAGMAEGHCQDTDSPDDTQTSPAVHCAMACAALVAPDISPPAPLTIAPMPPAVAAASAFTAHQPESDPPPPKFA